MHPPRLPPGVEPDPRLLEAFPAEEPMSYDQATLATRLASALRQRRAEEGLDWHIGVNDAVEYEQPDEEGRTPPIFPDLFVVTGVAQLPPGVFRTWTLRRGLDVVCEFSTRDSVASDRAAKRALYERALAVPEYFVFDTEQVAIPGLLEGWRLDATGAYRSISPLPTSTKAVRLHSERLGLDLEVLPFPFVAGRYEVRALLPGDRTPLLTEEETLARREKDEALRAKDDALRAKDDALRAKDDALRVSDEALRAARARIAALEGALRPPRDEGR